MHIAYNKTDHKTRVESQKNSLTVAYFDQGLHGKDELLFLTSRVNSKQHKLRCSCNISQK